MAKSSKDKSGDKKSKDKESNNNKSKVKKEKTKNKNSSKDSKPSKPNSKKNDDNTKSNSKNDASLFSLISPTSNEIKQDETMKQNESPPDISITTLSNDPTNALTGILKETPKLELTTTKTTKDSTKNSFDYEYNMYPREDSDPFLKKIVPKHIEPIKDALQAVPLAKTVVPNKEDNAATTTTESNQNKETKPLIG